ncbi:MAG: isoleucine-tRNA ligase [Trizodia sp. TS-e1964]|nr:MAG: isoleucine-tRNA ligase [Trizodia sp. TS-e1964]
MSGFQRVTPKSWTSTLQLPKSTFPARRHLPSQQTLLKSCTDDLYRWQRSHRPSSAPFNLHDGPPYANGSLHIGHALNRILKDIICRVKVAQGRRVEYVPGWDCHGLPIELKALEQLSARANEGHENIAGAIKIRRAAAELASQTVEKQKTQLKQWAIMADWDGAWRTLDENYVIEQLKIFQKMAEKSLIYRQFKPVYWSPSSGTALAEAELEYNPDHISTDAFIRMPIVETSKYFKGIYGDFTNLNAVIWTTTPWTLPANKAIAVHTAILYTIIHSESFGYLLLAKSRLENTTSLSPFKVVVDSLPGSDLVGQLNYLNPFQEENLKPFIHGDFVTEDSGTGLVHCAPGHGMEDYIACSQKGIAAFAPVDDKGRFTSSAMAGNPHYLAGADVLTDGTQRVLSYLESLGHVLKTGQIKHRYPYDWRTKLPLIIRATEQWFANVASIRDEAIKSLDNVAFIPQGGRTRLESFVKTRSEWCISRQRAWGVPIPVLYRTDTNEALLSSESVTHIINVIKERGIDSWWTDAENEVGWIHPTLLKAANSDMYVRGKDTMDVWFDSGTSWTQIQDPDKISDIYLEGSDQHRGWFQSSLLTRIAVHDKLEVPKPSGQPTAPYKTLITHGFVLDHAGRKMSKSIGNIIAPEEIMDSSFLAQEPGKNGARGSPKIEGFGADALRLWVASSDYTKDVVVGRPTLLSVNNNLKKLRVTLKLLLGTLEDWDRQREVPHASLMKIDQIALLKLAEINRTVAAAYDSHEFYGGLTAQLALTHLFRYISKSLSAQHFEFVKDRLYTCAAQGAARSSAQTTMTHILEHLLSILAPITPIMVEEVWTHMPAGLKVGKNGEALLPPSRRLFPEPPTEWTNPELAADAEILLATREVVCLLQEQAKQEGNLRAPLESDVALTIHADAKPLKSCLAEPSKSPQAIYTLFSEYQATEADKDSDGTTLETLFQASSVDLEIQDPLAATASAESAESQSNAVLPTVSWSYSASFSPFAGTLITVRISSALGSKCARCWRYKAPPANEPSAPTSRDAPRSKSRAAGNGRPAADEVAAEASLGPGEKQTKGHDDTWEGGLCARCVSVVRQLHGWGDAQ